MRDRAAIITLAASLGRELIGPGSPGPREQVVVLSEADEVAEVVALRLLDHLAELGLVDRRRMAASGHPGLACKDVQLDCWMAAHELVDDALARGTDGQLRKKLDPDPEATPRPQAGRDVLQNLDLRVEVSIMADSEGHKPPVGRRPKGVSVGKDAAEGIRSEPLAVVIYVIVALVVLLGSGRPVERLGRFGDHTGAAPTRGAAAPSRARRRSGPRRGRRRLRWRRRGGRG